MLSRKINKMPFLICVLYTSCKHLTLDTQDSFISYVIFKHSCILKCEFVVRRFFGLCFVCVCVEARSLMLGGFFTALYCRFLRVCLWQEMGEYVGCLWRQNRT